MNDSPLVCVLHGSCNHLYKCRRLPRWQGTFANQLLKALPFNITHRKERLSLVFADIEDRHDVGVIKPSGGFRFTPKTTALFLRRELAGYCHFQGDNSVQSPLPCFVDDPHPSLGDDFQDFVIGNCVRDRRERLAMCGVGLADHAVADLVSQCRAIIHRGRLLLARLGEH